MVLPAIGAAASRIVPRALGWASGFINSIGGKGQSILAGLTGFQLGDWFGGGSSNPADQLTQPLNQLIMVGLLLAVIYVLGQLFEVSIDA